MTVGEIAAVLGWRPQRVSRWLDRLAQRDPSVIIWAGTYRTTTLALLRRVAPDIARRFATDKDINRMQEEQEEQAHEIKMLARDSGENRRFRKQAFEWFRRLDERLKKLEKVA